MDYGTESQLSYPLQVRKLTIEQNVMFIGSTNYLYTTPSKIREAFTG